MRWSQTKTPWTIRSTWGGTWGIKTPIANVGAGKSTLYLRLENEESKEQGVLHCRGVDLSAGVTVNPVIGYDGSVEQMPSGGIGNIYDHRFFGGALRLQDLEGFAVVTTATMKGIAGGSISTISFCRLPPVNPAFTGLSEKAVGFFSGMVVGSTLGISVDYAMYYASLE